MGNKKNDKKQQESLFSSEIQQMKIEFKEMIDDMPNEEFLALSCILMTYMHDLEDEYMDDDWNDDYFEDEDDCEDEHCSCKKHNVRKFAPKKNNNEDMPF